MTRLVTTRPREGVALAFSPRGLLIAAAVLLLTADSVLAHDFWIEPDSFRPSVGTLLAVRLQVGEPFAGRPVARDPQRVERFLLAGPSGERPVLGRDGQEPAGVVRVGEGGTLIVGYHSRPFSIELPADRFEAYLRAEGLERIVGLRASRGESDEPGREIFSRCAKALVTAGGGDAAAAAGFDRPLGFPLELVPERDPAALVAGERLPIQLLLEARPLSGALVVATRRGQPDAAWSGRTDAAGLVRLPLDAPGDWLITAVHMMEAPPRSAADWHSLWASLTFQTHGAGR